MTTGKFRKSAGTTNGNGNATVNAMLPGNKSTAKSTGGTTGGGDGMDGDEFGNVNEVEIRARRMNVAQVKSHCSLLSITPSYLYIYLLDERSYSTISITNYTYRKITTIR